MIRPTVIATALALSSSPLAGQAASDSLPEGVTVESMREGLELFQGASCRSCHGDMGRGSVNGPSLQDGEWLHSEGDYEGIFTSIRWGVREDEIKAETRPFEMRPRGGMLFSTPQMRAIAAYIWGQENGAFEKSAEDLIVDLVFAYQAEDGVEKIEAAQAATGAFPIAADRLSRILLDIFDYQSDPDKARRHADLGLEAYPEHAPLHFTAGRVYALSGDLDRGEELVVRALELDPGLSNAENFLQRIRNARGGN